MKLCEIQKNLVAPKGQFNSFAKFKYRSCEDILEAVKPLLGDSILTISDEIVLIGDRYYVKATAVLVDGTSTHKVSGYAREPENKKGMDASQITGTASSYARKYALNGLFCIDDAKDADTDEHQQQTKNDNKKNSEPIPDARIMSKLIVMLEENMDGKKVGKAKLQALLWVKFKKYPTTEVEAQKTVKYLIDKDMLSSITEKK